jgi:hypothetical protein
LGHAPGRDRPLGGRGGFRGAPEPLRDALVYRGIVALRLPIDGLHFNRWTHAEVQIASS